MRRRRVLSRQLESQLSANSANAATAVSRTEGVRLRRQLIHSVDDCPTWSTKKCTEPVTPSSGSPTDRRRSGCRSENLQPRALRTRCKPQSRDPEEGRQELENPTSRKLRSFLYTKVILRPRLLALGRFASEKGRARRPGRKVRRAGNAFVHLPGERSASAYGSPEGFALPAPRARRRRDCKSLRTRMARPGPNEFRANCDPGSLVDLDVETVRTPARDPRPERGSCGARGDGKISMWRRSPA